MAKKKCQLCGRFMRLTDVMPDSVDFDYELAIECGLTPDQETDARWDYDGKWSHFHYIQDLWECENCQIDEWHTEGKRYYWNYAEGNYSEAYKPLTPKEQAELERQAQAARGDWFAKP